MPYSLMTLLSPFNRRGEGQPKLSRQERTDILSRISVVTAYDPWELLDVLTRAKGTDVLTTDVLTTDVCTMNNGNGNRSVMGHKGDVNSENDGNGSNEGHHKYQRKRQNGQSAPSLKKPLTPKHDLIVIDCLHSVISPYFKISVPEAKSVSSISVNSATSGTVGLLGKKMVFSPIYYTAFFHEIKSNEFV